MGESSRCLPPAGLGDDDDDVSAFAAGVGDVDTSAFIELQAEGGGESAGVVGTVLQVAWDTRSCSSEAGTWRNRQKAPSISTALHTGASSSNCRILGDRKGERRTIHKGIRILVWS